MYTTINEFIDEWNGEAASTQKLLDVLTDSSLGQQVTPSDRTLGRIAWHIVTSTPGMLSHFGLEVEQVQGFAAVPTSAKEIAETFQNVSAAAVEAVKSQWTDASLQEVLNVFGMQMPRAASLSLLLKHIIHHRGQLTVLMRQAGLTVPGVYGPAREEWAAIGMEAPTV